jgi:hypothetical protein
VSLRWESWPIISSTPASELANLCAELFSHIVFWNYDSFDLVNLRSTLDDVRWQ